jgi:hypothetical protein
MGNNVYETVCIASHETSRNGDGHIYFIKIHLTAELHHTMSTILTYWFHEEKTKLDEWLQ